MMWVCEKFVDYILGKDFIIEMDYKLLVLLLGFRCFYDMFFCI